MGNPSLDDVPDLVILDRWNSADDPIVDSFHKLEDKGKKQHQDFQKDDAENCARNIYDTNGKNFRALFSSPQPTAKTKIQVHDGAIIIHYLLARVHFDNYAHFTLSSH
ncbi:Hypothetical predicted protein [Podarcis lilfordi]|uniref:Uncharacterized protein n=1 Tax=Podarcis lilfordi TaxID=74358 RepID=A0AA35K8J0_9SAUR|nr:Hypothetical predicted protein [Podarcis lilfordi]